MTNKHLAAPPNDIMLARLNILFESINDLYSSGSMVLESDIVSSFHEALNLFFESLDGSIIGSVMKIYAGAPSDPGFYNIFTSAILKDIRAIFSEVGALDTIIASSFNSIISEHDQALRASKRVSNKLGDYLLYADADTGPGFFFGDSFTTSDRIEVGSDLVETAECFINTDEGIVLLPLDGDPDIPAVKSIIVNSGSNGEAGNNYQEGIFGHEDIEVISDNEPNTWFEYEHVTSIELSSPLVLDITIALGEISVINHINVNPINFGSPIPVRIATIETSENGSEYKSIKHEIPIKDYVSEQNIDEFTLSPATSKFSGQGFYSFLPRKIQYVHIVFEQHTAYTIHTNTGERLRYAIGLRDINILGRKFQLEGSVVSTPFISKEEIRKVSVWASENPTEQSVLADIKHFISHNDGALWHPIQPQKRDGFDIPEIVNFNNISPNSVTTVNPVDTLRHKISIKRDKKAFKGDNILKEERLTKMDVTAAPVGGEFEIGLTEHPIKESVNILFPFNGSFSCPRPRYDVSGTVKGKSTPMDLDFVEFNVDAPGKITKSDGSTEGTLRFTLPFENIPNLKERIRVFVNGEQIEYCAQDSEAFVKHPGSYTTGIDTDSKVYFLNKGGKELQFGLTDSGDVQRGYIPMGGSKVQVCLDGDNPFIRLTERGYILNLTVPCDGQRDAMNIVAINSLTDEEVTDYGIEVPTGTDKYTSVFNNVNPLGQKHNTIDSSTKSNLKINETIEIEHELEDILCHHGTYVGEGQDGMLPPVFLEGTSNFWIEQYSWNNELLVSDFTDKVAFIDGDTELRDRNNNWEKVATRYTFDHETGTVFLGAKTSRERRTIVTCKKRDLKIITPDLWEFDRNIVTGRINTQKILLDPSAVYTMPREEVFTYVANTRSITLIDSNVNEHDWTNGSIIRGTVRPDDILFAANVKPIEVKFIDGVQEFSNIINIEKESMVFTNPSGDLYTHQLVHVDPTNNKELSGVLKFVPVRGITSATTPESQFTTQLESTDTPTGNGEWNVTSTGLVTLYLDTGEPENHTVNYDINNTNPGLDLEGLYSIDYSNNIVHFEQDIPATGKVTFDVSVYSAFYNLAKQVPSYNISSINEEGRSIIFNPEYSLQFLKLDTAAKARPQVLKVFYEYYKRATESLEELEPYWSPICKDVAFKAITANILEEL